MKIKLLFLITFISFSNTFAQNFEKLFFSKKDKPTVLINKNIIANFELIKQIPSSKIIKMEVMKSTKNGVDLYAKTYPNLSQYGLILVEMTFDHLETKTQNEIKEFLGADPETKFYIDGFLVMNDDLLIATKSIHEIEFINANEQDLNEEKIINLWTLPKENRLGSFNLSRKKIQVQEISK